MLFACSKKQDVGLRKHLNEKNLPAQIFSFNTEIDNTLMTKKGCVIKIPKGSLESNTPKIKLEVREALTNTDMVLAGLTTMSGGQPLASGGMIYINAAEGYQIKIKKQLEVLIPTKTFNSDMQVFKGEENEEGKIDWKDPVLLPKDETLKKIDTGELLFKANCANCHKLNFDYTGPTLYGITYRKSKQWLADFTRNPAKMIAEDYYSACLFNTWKPTVMTSFPELTDRDLENIYGYIKAETDKEPAINNDYGQSCCDSCELYSKELDLIRGLQDKRKQMVEENGTFFNLNRQLPISDTSITFSDSVGLLLPDIEKEKVKPELTNATFYTINVSAFGWYNIDILLKEFSSCEPSELFVRMQGSYKLDFNINLIIPSHKVFVEGGKLKDGEDYGFDETNGKIPLPHGATCFIIAFAEFDDKIIFGKTSFIANERQKIILDVKEITKEELAWQIISLNLDGVEVDVKDSKNADTTRITDKRIDSLKSKLPKNCDCGSLVY